MNFNYKPAGDSAILMDLDSGINEETNTRIIHLASFIESKSEEGFGEVIIGYQSVLVQYNPLKLSYQKAIDQLKRLEEVLNNTGSQSRRTIEIPVLYGGDHGPDLEKVAQHNKLTIEDVISIHSKSQYLVYFLGFTPGYPFMGGMSKEIATPRLESPRFAIPPGSVGIAKDQTGIYPVASPGGWNLIGNTPLRLYNSEKSNPFLLKAGDFVTFRSIQVEEYDEIKDQVEKDTYKLVIDC
ncbi:5-oxoprolinase subunit PxpB [Sporosarcina siberiensis]|uniref:5-oxoprolinase subunit PxpB n=1 Tax=Sporosarcina siberiensis TaxID=1365606 RepID=A0ABW4SDL5_9BACL